MRKLLIFMLLIVLISCKKNEQDADLLINNFFLTYKNIGVEEAFNYIFETNKFLNSSTEDITTLKENLIKYIPLIGEFNGYEIVSTRSIGECLKHYTCILKYDKQPLRFNFTFYKSLNSWILYDFNYTNTFIEELNEAAKFYYIE